MDHPDVGIGVVVRNSKGEILLGLRKNAHGDGTWAFPGGRLKKGESFSECASREVLEETDLEISNLRCVGVTNDLFKDEGKHYISVFMEALSAEGVPEVMEPNKCERWEWFSPRSLPSPLFLTIKNLQLADPCECLHVLDWS